MGSWRSAGEDYMLLSQEEDTGTASSQHESAVSHALPVIMQGGHAGYPQP